MTTYSITLDDVDLALLPLRTHNNNFLKKEHYQFQVMKESIPESSANTYYKCHICAIDVPAAFASEHAASVKHRANARIASVAATRTRDLISALPPTLTYQSAQRFCANCADIVDEDHDKTKEHRVAVMHDNLLWELMKAYVGDGDEKDDTNNNIVQGNQDTRQVRQNDDRDHNSIVNHVNNNALAAQAIDKNIKEVMTENKADGPLVADCNNANTKKTETIKTVKIENNQTVNSVVPSTSTWAKIISQSTPTTAKGTTQNDTSTPTVNKEETLKQKTKGKGAYETELQKFMGETNNFQIREIYNRIHIKINDDIVNVYSDHFHSFHRSYNREIECIVCDRTFNDSEYDTHVYNLNHMSCVVKLGNDGEYVRKVTEVYSHCILCNQKVNNINVEKHKQSQHHKNRKSNNVKTDAKKASTEENVEKNINGAGELAIANEPYKEVSGELHCLVCDCRVPKDVRNRKDHVKGLRHLNNLKNGVNTPVS